ncbi:MAG: hypothetical protein WCJ49_02885 [Deltaproteobacteria bacterium]
MRERALTLARAGEKLLCAINNMKTIEADIVLLIEEKKHMQKTQQQSQKEMINKKIQDYNQMRKHAKLRYYYLLVTREAIGLRHHKTVEEIYKIRPAKGCI